MRTGILINSLSVLFCISLAIIPAGGCSSQQTAPPPEPSTALVPASELRGLTVRWLSVSADEGQRILLRALENAAVESPGLSAIDRRRWADQGLGIAFLPAVKVRALESLLPITAVQANNSADILTWSVLATGPEWAQERPIASPDGTTVLAPGRIRLLGRSWAAPTLTETGLQTLTRLELTLQHLLERQPLSSLAGPTDASKGALSRGPSFARTSIGLDLPPDLCLVIFAESPGANRQAILRPETLDRPETTSSDPSPAPAAVPTLGDLLLTGYGPESQIRSRVVLLIMGRPAAAAAKLDQ